VVTDTAEWRALRAASGRGGAAEEGLFATGPRVLVHGHETISIPLRFLCLHGTGVRDRSIRVTFTASEIDAAALDVHVHPMAPLIDRTLRFDAREKEILRRRILLDGAPAPARVWCDSPDAVVEAVTVKAGNLSSGAAHSGAIDLRVRCDRSPAAREFLVVLADDIYMARIRETWRITVQPLHWVDVRAVVGQSSTTTLVVRGGDVSQRVQIFSSFPALVQVCIKTKLFSCVNRWIQPIRLIYLLIL